MQQVHEHHPFTAAAAAEGPAAAAPPSPRAADTTRPLDGQRSGSGFRLTGHQKPIRLFVGHVSYL